jgi:Tat protein translocase TatB subunit
MGFEIFGVGMPEMVVILVIALIFLGPERLPEVARTMGTWVRELRRMSSEAMGIWQETLGVGDEIRQAVNPANLLAPAARPPAADPALAAAPLSVPYTPPAAAATNGEAAEPAVLAYPAPFEGPPPPEPPKLWYPAPFGEAEETE